MPGDYRLARYLDGARLGVRRTSGSGPRLDFRELLGQVAAHPFAMFVFEVLQPRDRDLKQPGDSAGAVSSAGVVLICGHRPAYGLVPPCVLAAQNPTRSPTPVLVHHRRCRAPSHRGTAWLYGNPREQELQVGVSASRHTAASGRARSCRRRVVCKLVAATESLVYDVGSNVERDFGRCSQSPLDAGERPDHQPRNCHRHPIDTPRRRSRGKSPTVTAGRRRALPYAGAALGSDGPECGDELVCSAVLVEEPGGAGGEGAGSESAVDAHGDGGDVEFVGDGA